MSAATAKKSTPKRATGRGAARNTATAANRQTATSASSSDTIPSSNGMTTNRRRSKTPQEQSTATVTGKHGTLLEKMFVDMLKDIYWAEQHLVDHLQEMQQSATTDELQEAFEDHMLLTKKHVSRLEKVFTLIGEKAEAKKCEAMNGLTKEATYIIGETEDGTMTRDAALIIAAQKIEHYEIATYGSLVQVARTLGHDKAADLLEKTLWEEEDTDCMLTEIAETHINPMADTEEDDEETDTDEDNEDEDEDDEEDEDHDLDEDQQEETE